MPEFAHYVDTSLDSSGLETVSIVKSVPGCQILTFLPQELVSHIFHFCSETTTVSHIVPFWCIYFYNYISFITICLIFGVNMEKKMTETKYVL